jgi:hypothetical protein
MFGAMAKDIKVHGLIIKCMVKDNYGGLMVKCILVISKRIKDMVMDSLSGRMAENMMENGYVGNSMVLVFIEITRVKKGKVNGLKAKEFNG